MALISRFSLVCSRKCGNTVLSSLGSFSHCRFNPRILTNFESVQASFRLQTIGSFHLQQRYQSTKDESKQKTEEASSSKVTAGNKLSQKARLKQAVRDYGSTIIVFHVAISLASLGICYAAISNGVDAVSVLSRLGFPESVISSNVAIGGSTFVMAYAVHKAFAPVRIAVTLSSAPLIVRYLRKKNLIKPPK